MTSGEAAPPRAAVLPQLSVRGGLAALAFYAAAFGAEVVYQVGGTQDNPSVVAQLSVGDGAFWVSDESPENRHYSPETLGGTTVRLLLIVDDPAAVARRAIELGATEVVAVTSEHGWLLGRIEDPFGHHWEIGRPLGEWPPVGGRPLHP